MRRASIRAELCASSLALVRTRSEEALHESARLRYRMGDHHDAHAGLHGCVARRSALSFVRRALPLSEQDPRKRFTRAPACVTAWVTIMTLMRGFMDASRVDPR